MKLWKKLTAAVLMSAAMLGAGLTAKPCLFTPAGAEITAQAAEKVTVGDLTFTKYNTYAEVNKCSKTAETVVIPAEIVGLPVTGIGESAFSGCTSLTSITLPNSVKSIGVSAFYGCAGLKSITLPDSVKSTGVCAFAGCTGLTSITLPDGLISIGSSAFEGCSGLTSITIPDSVKRIREFAFNCCTGLISITIGNSVTYIDEGAFQGCTSLKNITLPNSVTYIGEAAFARCTGLTSITLPASLTSIERTMVEDCSSLTSITIPDSVTSIGNSAFSGCTGLKSITIPDGVTSIGSYAFYGCRGLTSITIPDSVTSIGERAFYCCTGLTSITIPDSVKSIGDRAFENCKKLTSITIPDSVTSIGERAFYCCTGLTIRGIPGSYAEQFALNHSIPFESVYTVPITSVTLSQTEFAYTGKAVKIGSYIRVKSNGTALKYGTDFTMTYANNVKCGVGTASVTIKGIGDYFGTVTKYYSILPAQQDKPVLCTWNGRLGKLRVSWQADANAKGYEVQYCRDASFTGDTLHSHYFAKATTCLLVTYPKPGEKWYVRVRAYVKDRAGERFGFYSDVSCITLGKIDNVKLTQTEFAYTGNAVKVGSYIRVKSGTTALKYGTDFELIYKNNTDKGTASVTVKGIGEYAGSSVTKTYKIK